MIRFIHYQMVVIFVGAPCSLRLFVGRFHAYRVCSRQLQLFSTHFREECIPPAKFIYWVVSGHNAFYGFHVACPYPIRQLAVRCGELCVANSKE